MPFPLHCRAQVLGLSIIATIKLPIKMDRLLLTWEPAGCLRSGFPHIWFSLLDKYTALYWMSHPRVSPHFTGLLCHYSHSTSCFSEVETGSLTADRCFFQLKYCFKKIPVSYDYQSLMIVWNAQEARNTAQYLRSVYGPQEWAVHPPQAQKISFRVQSKILLSKAISWTSTVKIFVPGWILLGGMVALLCL